MLQTADLDLTDFCTERTAHTSKYEIHTPGGALNALRNCVGLGGYV